MSDSLFQAQIFSFSGEELIHRSPGQGRHFRGAERPGAVILKEKEKKNKRKKKKKERKKRNKERKKEGNYE